MQENQQTHQNLLFEARIQTRWGDMDALGHVNNVVYLRYFEEARVQWLHTLGLDVEGNAQEGPVIITAHITYLKPVFYPADLVIKLYGNKPGTSSMMISHTLARADEPDLIHTSGDIKIVWVNQKTGKSTPLPEKIRALLPI